MNESDVHAFLSNTLMTTLIASAPILGVALVTGLVIAFFQALTQVQEMTLTFVPKIAVIFLVVILASPFMYEELKALSDAAFDRIASGIE
jgi:flagellar biosynthetic protein FliQ